MFDRRLPLSLALLAALTARQVAAHGYCIKFGVGDQTYAGFDPTWAEGPSILGATPQRPADNVDTQWADYTTEQIATGSYKTSEVLTPQLTAPAKAGDKITIWYDQWPQRHSGPIMRYMASCGGSCDGVPAGDLDWFKINEVGYTDGWPTDDLLPSNEYTQSFNLPTDLPGGAYLLANHMLAMHTAGGPQFYPVAFQIDLESSGTVDPQPKGKFPDIYLNGPQDFATWNIYEHGANNANMKLPGISVYSGASGGGRAAAAPATPATPAKPSKAPATNPPKTASIPTEEQTPVRQPKVPAPTASTGTTTPGDDEAPVPQPKSPGKSANAPKLDTPTGAAKQPKASDVGEPEMHSGGGATVTVTVYADAPAPTGLDTETTPLDDGGVDTWDDDSMEEEPPVEAAVSPETEKTASKALGVNSFALEPVEDESPVDVPEPTGHIMTTTNAVKPHAGKLETVETPPFDPTNCILRFDESTGQYAREVRRSRIVARYQPGRHHGVTPAALPPCTTFTLSGKAE